MKLSVDHCSNLCVLRSFWILLQETKRKLAEKKLKGNEPWFELFMDLANALYGCDVNRSGERNSIQK